MPDKSTKPTTLKKLSKKALETPVTMVIGEGESPDKHVLGMSETVEPKALMKKLKREAEDGVERWAFGKMKVEKTEVSFAPEKKFSGLKNVVKEACAENSLKIRKCKIVAANELEAQ